METLKHVGALLRCAATVTCILFITGASAQSEKDVAAPSETLVNANGASPIYNVRSAGYRPWELLAVSREEGSLHELRGILGNSVPVKAYPEGTLPFPDGAIISKLAWKQAPSDLDKKALGHSQAFVPGAPTTLQLMVKDSKKYASTGGRGYGRFIDGKPTDKAQHETCFPCRAAYARGQDFLFTRFAPH
jgi:hypothetical protein